MTGTIRASVDGAVGRVTLSNPESRNALTLEMYRDLPRVLSQLAGSGARAVIVTGEGRKAFSAGGDISEFDTVRAAGKPAQAYNEAVANAERALESCPVPVIAAVHGACVGGGCGLALACDFRIADTAARFGVTAARMGLVYGLESTRRLVDAVGRGAASRLLFTATLLSADQALRVGLVDELQEPDRLESRAEELAHSIAELSPVSIRGAKRILRSVTLGVLEETPQTARLRNESFSSADYREGVEAFLAGRPARFSGR